MAAKKTKKPAFGKKGMTMKKGMKKDGKMKGY